MLRPAPAELAALVRTSHGIRVRVDAWRGDQLLAESIPLVGGDLTDKADQAIRESVTLTVPAIDRMGTRWAPTGPTSPLAAYGQRLHITYLVTDPSGAEYACQLGWFVIDEWEADYDQVEVTALGLLTLPERDRFTAPTSPPAGATFTSELARLLSGWLPLEVTGLTDRAVPGSMSWQDDRLGALYELTDAWPAELTVDPAGQARATPVATAADPAELTLAEADGVLIDTTDQGDREGVYNVVVARGEDSSDPNRPPVVATSEDTDPASPTYVGGPYGRVVRLFASPLLTTADQAQKAADTIRAKSARRTAEIPATLLPDPRLTTGTRVDLVRASGQVARCVLTSVNLPLTADGGAQQITLGEL